MGDHNPYRPTDLSASRMFGRDIHRAWQFLCDSMCNTRPPGLSIRLWMSSLHAQCPAMLCYQRRALNGTLTDSVCF